MKGVIEISIFKKITSSYDKKGTYATWSLYSEDESIVCASVNGAKLSNLKIYAPYGYFYTPVSMTYGLFIKEENDTALVGVSSEKYELLEGEILIKAASGASLKLSKDGDIIINGKLRIDKNGEIAKIV